MIKVLIDDIQIEVPKDFSIQLNFQNPLFSETKFNDAYSYPFSLPAAPAINNLFKNSYRINRRTIQIRRSVKIYYYEVLMLKGTITIDKTPNNTYSCFVRNDALERVKELKEKKFSDIDFGSHEIWKESEDIFSHGFKLQRWAEFIEKKNKQKNSDIKFPPINAKYYNISNEVNIFEPEIENVFHQLFGGVNLWIDGFFMKNSTFVKNLLIGPYTAGIPIQGTNAKKGEDDGLVFDATQNIIIHQIELYNVISTAQAATIYVLNSSNNIVDSSVFTIPSNSTGNPKLYTATVNLDVPKGTNYKIVINTEAFLVFVENSNLPINSPGINLKSGWDGAEGNNNYYFFFDLKILLKTDLEQTQWTNTVLPAVSLDYSISKIADHVNLDIISNSLHQIDEYLRTYNCSNFVLDEIDDLGATTINIHGRRIFLNKHFPEKNVYSLFTLISELFQSFYIVDEETLSIMTANEVLNSNQYNYTKFASHQKSIENYRNHPYIVRYSINEEEETIKNKYIASNRYDNQDPNMLEAHFSDRIELGELTRIIRPGKEVDGKEIIIKHTPMTTSWVATPFKSNLDQLEDDFFLNNQDRAFYQNFVLSNFTSVYDTRRLDEEINIFSAEIISTERTDRYFPLLHQGEGKMRAFKLENGNIVFDDYYDIPIFSNFQNIKRIIPNSISNDFPLTGTPYKSKSLFLNEQDAEIETRDDGIYNNHYKDILDFISQSEEVTKTLYLPPHKVKELSKFKKVKHYIESEEGNFEGIVKAFSVTISNNGISPTQVKYKVRRYE